MKITQTSDWDGVSVLLEVELEIERGDVHLGSGRKLKLRGVGKHKHEAVEEALKQIVLLEAEMKGCREKLSAL